MQYNVMKFRGDIKDVEKWMSERVLTKLFLERYAPYNPICTHNIYIFTYDRVHVNGSACGHLKQKLITHQFLEKLFDLKQKLKKI